MVLGFILKLTQPFPLEAKPVVVMDPFTFITGDTEETIRKTGLRQIRVLTEADSSTALRGTNRRTCILTLTSSPQTDIGANSFKARGSGNLSEAPRDAKEALDQGAPG